MTENQRLVPTYPGGPLVSAARRAVMRASAEQHVTAVRETARAVHHTLGPHFGSGHERSYLFDPITMPLMNERANAVSRHLNTSEGIEYIDRTPPGTPPYDRHNPAMQAATFVHFVNEPNTVYVFRDGVDVFRWLWRTAWPKDRCNIRASAACPGEDAFYTRFLAVQRGGCLIFFEACLSCEEHLEDLALAGDILAEVDAQIEFESTAREAVDKWRAIRAAEQSGAQ